MSEKDEGLLKQHISRADGETKRWGEGYRTFVAKDSVYEVLDECKRDYHFGMPMIILSENPSKEEIQKAFSLLEKTLDDKDEWFLRNFGLPIHGYPSESQLKKFGEAGK